MTQEQIILEEEEPTRKTTKHSAVLEDDTYRDLCAVGNYGMTLDGIIKKLLLFYLNHNRKPEAKVLEYQ